MIENIGLWLRSFRLAQKVRQAVENGRYGADARKIVATDPKSWEFSGTSQNGEDGIIDYLLSRASGLNRYFIEIGASDGVENNSAWLANVKGYSGLMIEGWDKRSTLCQMTCKRLNLGSVTPLNIFVSAENVLELKEKAERFDRDMFSIDIDGNDLYLAKILLDAGLRPKVFVAEYNSAFGPEQEVTVRYRDDFDITKAHPTQLYYGVSVSGWRRFMESYGYRFITVDSSGTNCFFADPAHFDSKWLDSVSGMNFRENRFQQANYGNWKEQLKLLDGMELVNVSDIISP